MVTDLDLDTVVVVIVNVALVLPAATVTLPGSLAYDELSFKDTTAPPLGAGPLNVTVPWEVAPPVTVVGLIEREFNESADKTVIVTVAALLLFTPSLALYVKLSLPVKFAAGV